MVSYLDRHAGANEAEQKDPENKFTEVSLVRKLLLLTFFFCRLARSTRYSVTRREGTTVARV